ncbi:hypothetical protein R9C00_08870 [Flammeovirgaceae bacterium SG7u.111]|nr:hypothetical protein [Flammeovirgaceae bacterium SG7u.132]WPO37560.1 hypothetical protein R9C00_08870 [Flammeovirgaceae bacterium SG7u.111]
MDKKEARRKGTAVFLGGLYLPLVCLLAGFAWSCGQAGEEKGNSNKIKTEQAMYFNQWKKRHLDSLFLMLETAEDPGYNEQLVGEIWKTWLQSGDDALDELMQQGIKAISVSDYKEAVELFTEIIEENPEYAEGWNKRATVYYLNGEFKKSMDDIAVTLELEPRHFGALSGLTTIYMELGEQKRALDIIEKMLGINPYQPVLKRQADMIYAQLNIKRT